MKRVSVLLIIMGMLCFVLLGGSSYDRLGNTVSAASIANDPETQAITTTSDGSTLSEQEFIASAENVKLLGRTYLLDDTLWLAFSATGAEFTFTGTKAEITLVGDNVATSSGGEGHFCRVGIYVDDKLVYDELLKEQTKTVTAFESTAEKTVTIRVIKLTEAADSTVGIGKIKVMAKGAIKPTKAKAHRIEFIGDSITCGFGVDDSDKNAQFTTATENVSKTYAYKTAQSLKADYSMVALSGYGILSGYTGNGKINSAQLIPNYYEKVGFSYGYFNNSIKPDTLDWNFKDFEPELIVINLGTNDGSYCGRDVKKQKQFTNAYVKFLKQVRAKNPNAKILCTLGTMGDTLYPSVANAVKLYTKKTGDKNISSMKFDVQLYSDGYGACWHPSEITHTKAAKMLTAKIKKLMKW